jgi:hypothetical protein
METSGNMIGVMKINQRDKLEMLSSNAFESLGIPNDEFFNHSCQLLKNLATTTVQRA